MEHVAGCAQLEKRNCPKGETLHHEPKDQHWFSGWPGAYCLKCGDEDKDEICIGSGCQCPCHDAFWKEFDQAMAKHDTETQVEL